MKLLEAIPRSPKSRQTLLAITAALCLLAHTPAATARSKQAENTPATKKKGASKVTYQRSTSEESRAERDKRMYRECKGLPNAGACLGYARGK